MEKTKVDSEREQDESVFPEDVTRKFRSFICFICNTFENIEILGKV